MARLLVRGKHVDLGDERFDVKPGTIMAVCPDDQVFGRLEKPPNFVILNIPGATEATLRDLAAPWVQTIDYTVLSSNPNTAQYQIKVFGSNLSKKGRGAITLKGISNYLSDWGATVDSHTFNSVTFTVSLWQMLQGKGFWEIDPSAFSFQLNDYDSGTGVGTVTVTGPTPKLINAAAIQIQGHGGTVTNTDAQTFITFAIHRSVLLDAFRKSVKEKFEDVYRNARFNVGVDLVREALDHPEGYTISLNQLQAAVFDELDD
jgi:hypothetical protein